jgi:arylsulfatase A-like enzyme
MSILETRKPVRLLFALLLVPILLILSCKAPKRALVARKFASDGDPPGGPRIVPAAYPSPSGSPNIIFVLTDDLSLNLLQFMPHVLEMERNGATFANYFVTDSLCCPSRSSIFTGEFPHNTGVFRNIEPDGGYGGFNAHGNEPNTFAVALQRAGYRTAMLGKYLNGYDPTRNGPAIGWNEWDVAGFGYPGFNYSLNENGEVVRYGRKRDDYLTDVLSRTAIKFIKKSQGTPFFIEVATFAPHSPYIPAPRDARAFPGLLAPRTPAFNAAPDANAAKWLSKFGPLSAADMISINQKFRRRARSVLAIDKMIADLEAAVAAAGQEKNTYFIFSSDNGIHMGEHRLMPGKMTAFDTDIHVPLIITGPRVAPTRVLNEIVENTDLCSTFAELAGVASPPTVDGRSVVPLLREEQVPEWRTLALIEHHGPLNESTDDEDPDVPTRRSGNPPTYEAIRARGSVYVEYNDGTREYHDYAWDPYELRNTFSSLSPRAKASLHAAVDALRICRGEQACWNAARPAKIPNASRVSHSERDRPRHPALPGV